jgi:hypothetical protein
LKNVASQMERLVTRNGGDRRYLGRRSMGRHRPSRAMHRLLQEVSGPRHGRERLPDACFEISRVGADFHGPRHSKEPLKLVLTFSRVSVALSYASARPHG